MHKECLMMSLLAAGCALGAVTFPEARIELGDNSSFAVGPAGTPVRKALPANPSASRGGERAARTALAYPPVAKGGLQASFSRVAIPGTAYQRCVVTLKNCSAAPVRVNRIVLFENWTPGAADGVRSGNTDGAVAVFPSDRFYVGAETPLAKLDVKDGRATAILPREYEIRPGETWAVSYVVGRFDAGQLRRDFQTYLDAERAHPYRVLPHYNSWYDLNIGRNDGPWDKRMNEAEALGAMKAFRKELGDRGVFINSYLWDDGWDEWNSLWDFHKGFPNGFRALADEAHKNPGASIGAWMSPCGGYGGSCRSRVQYAKEKGIIGPNDGLLRMSSPTYYKAFRDRVLFMIRNYDMNLFKFDRMGVGHDCDTVPASVAPDMEAIVRLIGEMRAAKPDVFINCTVGTWASPFWVMFADSIWRGDGDFGRKGPGRARQQWITYRDNQVHDRFVAQAPLYPLNSMMVHGIIVSRHGPPGCMDVADTPASTVDFADEVWMGVACGTGLQEYYITPALMHKDWWDTLAAGVKWLKANEPVLRDVHWIGGDPVVGNTPERHVYGYASLGAKKGILIVRNPSDKPDTFVAPLDGLLEMPAARKGTRIASANVVYSHDVTAAPLPPTTAGNLSLSLQPFGVYLVEVRF